MDEGCHEHVSSWHSFNCDAPQGALCMSCVHKHVSVDNESCEQLRGGSDTMQYAEEVLRSPLSADGPRAAVIGRGNESDSIPFTSVRPVVEEVPSVVPIVHSQSYVIARSLCPRLSMGHDLKIHCYHYLII